MKSKCLWFTGLPCSGKTTLAYALKKNFPNCKILDGDEIRSSPLGNFASFSKKDRKAHIIRMGYLAKMLCDQGVTVICSFVSPQREIREQVRDMFDDNQFVEIYLTTPLSVCAHRDVKGMYAKAKAGKIPDFTGVQSAYEPPVKAEISLDTSTASIEESCDLILKTIKPWRNAASLFIGRWNGVFHNGHDTIIQTELQKGKYVTLAVRDVKPDEKNPWTASEVKEMLEYRFQKEPKVKVVIIPDLESVNYGRGVGYQVKEIKVVQSIALISGTECREKIKKGDSSWKTNVPTEIAKFLERKNT